MRKLKTRYPRDVSIPHRKFKNQKLLIQQELAIIVSIPHRKFKNCLLLVNVVAL